MATIVPELNLKNIIAELREFTQAVNEFADDLERIENKYGTETEDGEFAQPNTYKKTKTDKVAEDSAKRFYCEVDNDRVHNTGSKPDSV